MEFFTVGRVKLKVTLTKTECAEYCVEKIEKGEPNEKVRESVRKILRLAESKASFTTSGERILVQIYPLADGGAELFVTKLCAIPERDRRPITESGILTYLGREAYYKFPDFPTLLLVSKILGTRPVDLYLGADGEYYLAAEEVLLGEISDCDILLEFGEKIHSLPLGISAEWGTQLLSSVPLSHFTDV